MPDGPSFVPRSELILAGLDKSAVKYDLLSFIITYLQVTANLGPNWNNLIIFFFSFTHDTLEAVPGRNRSHYNHKNRSSLRWIVEREE